IASKREFTMTESRPFAAMLIGLGIIILAFIGIAGLAYPLIQKGVGLLVYWLIAAAAIAAAFVAVWKVKMGDKYSTLGALGLVAGTWSCIAGLKMAFGLNHRGWWIYCAAFIVL